jgi:hypothetical protein
MEKRRWDVRLPIVAATALVALSSCSSFQATPSAQSESFGYVLTVSVEATESAQNLEQRYAGRVLVFHPEEGFAILGVNQAPDSTDPAVQGLESNAGAFEAPEARVNTDAGSLTPQGTANASGWSAWGGGWSAWGGGWSAWGSGGSSLTPTENQAAWAKIRLAQAQKLAPNLGAGVTVAVVDTGLDLNHSVFQGHLAPSANWKDFVDGDAVPQDTPAASGSNAAYGHGTSVAGIVLQVAPKATILPIRVLGPDGSGDLSAVTSGVDWAVSHGAKIINLSLGSLSSSSAIDAVIKSATQNGVMVITSSGNGSVEKMTYPAFQTHGKGDHHTGSLLMSVGSVNTSDIKSSFTNYGAPLELLAPGESIYGPAPGMKLGPWSGTSMAAPMVSGGLALALGQPTVKSTPDALECAIDSTADPIDSVNDSKLKNKLGFGRLNLENFLKSLGLK